MRGDTMTALRHHASVNLHLSLPVPEDWTEQALCAQVDPEAFFPEKGGTTNPAKRICARCPVLANCLAYALENKIHFGVWGGLSERERRRIQPAETVVLEVAS